MIARIGIPAVGYIRMSSDKQEASPQQQRKEIETYAAEHGYRIIDWYIDEGISGSRSDREASGEYFGPTISRTSGDRL